MNELAIPAYSYSAKLFDNLDVSEATKQDYGYRLPAFITFLHSNGFDHSSYIRYKQHLAGLDCSTATRNKHLITARIFLKELYRRGLLPVDITANVKLFKQSKQHKLRGLNNLEVEKLSAWLRHLPDGPEADRLKAIFSLLLLQGFRTIELCRLDVSDIDLTSEVAFVQGKARDDKEPVILMPQTVSNLQRYIYTNGIEEGALFRSHSHSNYGKPLSTRGLREIVTDIFQRLGINKTVHGTRHFYTTELLKAMPGELLDVAQFTRHRSLEMLRVYDNRMRMDRNSGRVAAAFVGIEF